jgi:hypothetical protein
MTSTIISLRDRQRSAGVTLLDLIDAELRHLTRTIVSCECGRRPDSVTERLLAHLSRLENIQRLALEVCEAKVSPPL